MLNALKLIMQASLGVAGMDQNCDRIAEAIDLALRNIKFGDDTQEYLENPKNPSECKALVEVITGFIDSQAVKPVVSNIAAPVAAINTYDEPREFELTAQNAHKYIKLYLRAPTGGIANKIGAIKAWREITGIGLKEAKDFIESLGPVTIPYPNKGSFYLSHEHAVGLVNLRSAGVNIMYTMSTQQ